MNVENVENLTLNFFNESGDLVMTLIWDRNWTTFDQGREWAEQVLRLTPKKQFDRFGTFVDASTIEDGTRVVWHCHQTGSPVALLSCDYARRAEAYRASKEPAPGEVHLYVRL